MSSRLTFLALLIAAAPAPAISQDLNTLDRHLENQRWQRLQDHQNRGRTMNARKPPSKQAQRGLEKCSEDHVPRAEYRRMEAEYGERLRADGKASADGWSREQSEIWHQQLKRQGICA